MNTATQTTAALVNREYKYGFVTEIENDAVPRGLSEETVRLISAKKNEPHFNNASAKVNARMRKFIANCFAT